MFSVLDYTHLWSNQFLYFHSNFVLLGKHFTISVLEHFLSSNFRTSLFPSSEDLELSEYSHTREEWLWFLPIRWIQPNFDQINIRRPIRTFLFLSESTSSALQVLELDSTILTFPPSRECVLESIRMSFMIEWHSFALIQEEVLELFSFVLSPYSRILSSSILRHPFKYHLALPRRIPIQFSVHYSVLCPRIFLFFFAKIILHLSNFCSCSGSDMDEKQRSKLGLAVAAFVSNTDRFNNYDGQHVFQEYTYKKITPCDVCREILRGHTRQGLKCKMCRLNVHPGDCQFKAAKCQPKSSLLRRQKSASEIESRPVYHELDDDDGLCEF